MNKTCCKIEYVVIVALNHEKIKKTWKKKKIKPFIDRHNWEGINYTLEEDDWKI